MQVTLFDADGRFLQTLDGPLELVILPTVETVGARWAEGEFGPDYYWVAGQALPRPPMLGARLQDNQLVGLPFNTTITINNTAYECDDDHAELEFEHPGHYRIVVTKWPYLDAEFIYENPTQ
ncbi:hypothetical protein [Allopusillimonas ginsengisoli]|uniref:hypothetical protein n=1 Tax=Allopusillimonas ginsengisoli TaxID=453575 RepID=UPI00101F41D9|nr:hypothetical protein [Allopusillimonas ginsengisoli]TEA79844.1 hypothetical protein ERE07_02585 [Allopusillimonas ginsengisoli]